MSRHHSWPEQHDTEGEGRCASLSRFRSTSPEEKTLSEIPLSDSKPGHSTSRLNPSKLLFDCQILVNAAVTGKVGPGTSCSNCPAPFLESGPGLFLKPGPWRFREQIARSC